MLMMKMRTKMMILMVMLMLMGVVTSQKRTDVCVDGPNDTAHANKRPQIGQQFRVDVECNLGEQGGTMYVKEFYDYQRNRGRVQVTTISEGVVDYFMDYDLGLILEVHQSTGQCSPGLLIFEPDRFLFGFQLNGVKSHIFSPSKALHFDDSNEQYVNSTVVRGIAVDHWKSCQYIEAFNATAEVHWYFSDSDAWVMQEGAGRSPVRMTAVGKMVLANQTVVPFNHEYNFFAYQPAVSPEHFEVPDGVFCPGRTDVGIVKPFPQVPDHVSFIEEIVNIFEGSYNMLEENYDSRTKFAMYKFKTTLTSSLTGVNRYQELNDYNSGVSYLIDTARGQCTISPVSSAMVTFSKVVGGKVIRMETPREFFQDTIGYQYTGVVKVRNIQAERWVGVTNQAKGFEGQNLTIVWDFAVDALNSWYDASLTHYRTPLQLKMFLPGQPLTVPTYNVNLFYFNTDTLALSLIDTEACFNNTERLFLRFYISKGKESIVRNNVYHSKLAIQTALRLHTGIAANRVTDIHLYFNPTNVEMTMDLMDIPPQFNDVAGVAGQNSLSDAFHLLNDSFNQGTFSFSFAQGDTVESVSPLCLETISPDTSAFNFTTELTCTPGAAETSSQFGAGAIAGTALGVLIAGGLGGGIAGFFFFR